MVYTFHETLFSNKGEWTTDTHYSIDEPQNVMLSEGSQMEKIIYSMIPVIQNVQKKWIYREVD